MADEEDNGDVKVGADALESVDSVCVFASASVARVAPHGIDVTCWGRWCEREIVAQECDSGRRDCGGRLLRNSPCVFLSVRRLSVDDHKLCVFGIVALVDAWLFPVRPGCSSKMLVPIHQLGTGFVR